MKGLYGCYYKDPEPPMATHALAPQSIAQSLGGLGFRVNEVLPRTNTENNSFVHISFGARVSPSPRMQCSPKTDPNST